MGDVGENIRDYCARFTQKYQRCEELGVSIPKDTAGMMLPNGAKLEKMEKQMVISAINGDFDYVKVAEKLRQIIIEPEKNNSVFFGGKGGFQKGKGKFEFAKGGG